MSNDTSTQSIPKPTVIINGKTVEETQEQSSTAPIADAVKENPFKPLLEHPDRYLWALAIVPLCLGLIEVGLGMPIHWAFYVIANIILCILDEKLLKQSERQAPEHWTIAIVPIYIWQRLKLNQQSKKIFYAWSGAFLLSLALTGMSTDSQIEATATQLVTEILEKQYGFGRGAQCVGVTINREVRDGFFKATAHLDNGNDLPCTLRVKGDQLEVNLQQW